MGELKFLLHVDMLARASQCGNSTAAAPWNEGVEARRRGKAVVGIVWHPDHFAETDVDHFLPTFVLVRLSTCRSVRTAALQQMALGIGETVKSYVCANGMGWDL